MQRFETATALSLFGQRFDETEQPTAQIIKIIHRRCVLLDQCERGAWRQAVYFQTYALDQQRQRIEQGLQRSESTSRGRAFGLGVANQFGDLSR